MSFAPGRRRFVQGTVALAGSTMIPRGVSAATATYTRSNISGRTISARTIDSYKKAVRAMLALPPSDPRNWYRIALTHALDCPHGNWWFLVWHRGYIGWFEKIIREMSGDPTFALPFWDWTTEPRVPAVMFEDVLNPENSAYIASYEQFRAKFESTIKGLDYWKRVTNADGSFDTRTPYGQILARQTRFPDDLWFDLVDNPSTGKLFCDAGETRSVTAAEPGLDDDALKAVARSTILDALSPRDFITFASPKARGHSAMVGFGVLEAMPHNLVHNALGTPIGFMSNNLSPVDPIFFLHHANVDRLWDVWTRKQLAGGYPILPDGYQLPDGDAKKASDYGKWTNEPFLFFVDEKGVPVKKTTAGDYIDTATFDYQYERGTGEEVLPSARADFGFTAPRATFNAKLADNRVTADAPARALVTLPDSARDPMSQTLLAFIDVDMPPGAGERWDVYVGNAAQPEHVATLAMFGHHGVAHGPVFFTVPIPTIAKRYFTAGRTVEIQLRARPSPSAHMHVVPQVTALRVEAM